jgi:hypothetical protein
VNYASDRRGAEAVVAAITASGDGNESEAWTYFRGPDGYLYELWQTLRPLKALPRT